MRIAVLAPGYPPAYLGGGPIRTVAALSRRAATQHEVLVMTSNRDLGQGVQLDVPSDQWVRDGGVEVYYATVDRPLAYWRALRKLRDRQPDLIYLNSYFNPRFSIVPRVLHRLRWWGAAPLLLAPRGELGAGALRIKGFKKRTFMIATRILGLDAGLAWHASSSQEAADIRQRVRSARTVFVRPNETDLPAESSLPTNTAGTRVRFVFLSRIAPMKGLDLALRALAGVSVPLDFDVYGSAEDAPYVARCRALARRVPDHVRVHFRGPVRPDAVRSVLAEYDALVLPTRGENFGHVVAEALSVSCPVITSAATPWTAVLESGGGVVVRTRTVESWTRTLDGYARQARARSSELRLSAGAAYESWRAGQDGPSVFDMFAERVVEADPARVDSE